MVIVYYLIFFFFFFFFFCIFCLHQGLSKQWKYDHLFLLLVQLLGGIVHHNQISHQEIINSNEVGLNLIFFDILE